MTIKVATYNIHKAIGLDRRRDPQRIIAVLSEIDADIVALQEADRRFGDRASALPLELIEAAGYAIAPVNERPSSIGWHGNALLVRRPLLIQSACAVPLPTLEPRGAIRADLQINGLGWRVVGMHLDLSGLRRQHQVQAILADLDACADPRPTVLMGDLNEWSQSGGALRQFAGLQILAPGRSFHTRRPVAELDRIILTPSIRVHDCGVHHSALAARASDHLPVWAIIEHAA